MYESHLLSRKNFAQPKAPLRMKNGAGAVALSIDDIGYNNTSFLYDSFSVAQAAAFPALTPMFTVPQSGSKTPAQTNMDAAGMLANNEMFDLKRVCVLLAFNTFPTDAANISQLVRVELVAKGRSFIYGPVLAFPGARGFKLTAVANNTAGLALNNIYSGITNGEAEIHNAFAFDSPIRISNNDGFKVNVIADTAFNMTATANGGLGTTIYVFLDGTRLRKVA